jgi:sigma-B regulation protein RsbU (phosphoserine phosphatase)
MASLLILKGANAGQRLPLQTDRVVLGRNPDCQVVISGTAVSRAHAHIVFENGQYFIEDLRSRNKTFVNNQEIAAETRVPLKDNDRIKICDFLCTFHDGPVLKPLPPELRPDEPEGVEEPGSTTVEATLSSIGSHVLLETQPAEKLNALLEITGFLSKTLEIEPLLARIVDSLFQLFKQADRVFLILRDEATGRIYPKIIKTRRPDDETTARFSRRIVNMCLENVQALLSDDASGDSRFALSQSIADFRIRSVMCAPLWSQDGSGFGVIQLDTQDRNKKFVQDDLALLLGVANQASIALENAKLHADTLYRERLKRDLELAREVQRSLLHPPPTIPGYDFFAFYEPAQEIGGDYYDFLVMPQGRVGILVGDVAGKGVPAALLMAKLSPDARTTMLIEQDPALAITKLNSSLGENGLLDRFVTLAAMVLDPGSHKVTMVNAGHPSPLVYRCATKQLADAVPTQIAGLPLGVRGDETYTSHQLDLNPGDCVLVFSDGVTDAMSMENALLHVEGIYNAISGNDFDVRSLGERVVATVKHHALGRSQHDDITLVCFGRQATEPKRAEDPGAGL